ncbi:MAG: hypothetical protein J0M04_16960 [Verrucomicrobia bacterium]|nr:hypothetical protein [Verrucomicrobiota bacterium]
MYGFRKPFTAGTYGHDPFQAGFKTWLVLAQVLGYTISKFIGIKVVSEMPAARRCVVLMGLVLFAELALALFGLVPPPWNAACLFLNGLPLGMVFGLVLGFLEGRRMTEAFVAGLCASFILADGFTKSVGTWLLESGVPERWMPAAAGFIFLPPLAGFVWMLRQVPPPDREDVEARSERTPMNAADRSALFRRYAPGLVAVSAVYLLITVLRSMRADFAPEIWEGLGVKIDAGVFTRSEMIVALGVLAVNGFLVFVWDSRRAFFLSLSVVAGGLGLLLAVLAARAGGVLPPFPFVVLMGLGLYLPYVAVHTTVFERFIAMTRERGNIGYLIYLADAFGYLGYVAVMVLKNLFHPGGSVLELFLLIGWVAGGLSLAALVYAILFFSRRCPANKDTPPHP